MKIHYPLLYWKKYYPLTDGFEILMCGFLSSEFSRGICTICLTWSEI